MNTDSSYIYSSACIFLFSDFNLHTIISLDINHDYKFTSSGFAGPQARSLALLIKRF